MRKEWEISAKEKLGRRFEDLVQRDRESGEREREEIGRLNTEALRRWKDVGVPGLGLGEKIRILSEVLSGAYGICDGKGARYNKIVRTFERFLERTQDVLDLRERNGSEVKEEEEEEEEMFIEPMPSEWKDEIFHVERKLQGWKADLESLGNPDSYTCNNEAQGRVTTARSTMSIILEKLSEAVEGMLAELSMMRSLEDEIMRREEEWIEKMNRNDDESESEGVVAGAIWRRT